MDAQKMGALIAALRKQKGMTQAQLAEKLHVTDKAVSKWERGAGLPDLENLAALSEELEISVTELMQGERSENREEVNEMADQAVKAAMEIEQYHRDRARRRMVSGVILCGLGLTLAGVGIHFLISPTVTMGSAEGPRAIFFAFKVEPVYPAAVLAAGAASAFLGACRIRRS